MTMLLPKFELHQPTTVDEAVALMKQFGDDFDFISGGTDLLPNYKCGLNARKNVISLAHIDQFKRTDANSIGAAVAGFGMLLTVLLTGTGATRAISLRKREPWG